MLAGRLVGLFFLVNEFPLLEYMVTNGLVACDAARCDPSGEKATPVAFPEGNTAGLESFVNTPSFTEYIVKNGDSE